MINRLAHLSHMLSAQLLAHCLHTLAKPCSPLIWDQASRWELTVLPSHHLHNRLPTTGQTVLFSSNGESLAIAGARGVYGLNLA